MIVLFDRAAESLMSIRPPWCITAAAADRCTMSVFDVDVPSPAEVWAEVVRAEAEGRPYFRFRNRRADGSVRDSVEAYSSPIDLGDRKLHYAIMLDVTERNRRRRPCAGARRRCSARTQLPISGTGPGHAQQYRDLVGRDEAHLWAGPRAVCWRFNQAFAIDSSGRRRQRCGR